MTDVVAVSRCSRCGGDVFPGATDCPKCGYVAGTEVRRAREAEVADRLDRPGPKLLLGRILAGQLPLGLLFALLLGAVVIAPPLIFALVFIGLVAVEPTALPWLSLILGPLAVLAIVGPGVVVLAVGIFRAARRLGPPGIFVKLGVIASVPSSRRRPSDGRLQCGAWLPSASP